MMMTTTTTIADKEPFTNYAILYWRTKLSSAGIARIGHNDVVHQMLSVNNAKLRLHQSHEAKDLFSYIRREREREKA